MPKYEELTAFQSKPSFRLRLVRGQPSVQTRSTLCPLHTSTMSLDWFRTLCSYSTRCQGTCMTSTSPCRSCQCLCLPTAQSHKHLCMTHSQVCAEAQVSLAGKGGVRNSPMDQDVSDKILKRPTAAQKHATEWRDS